LLNWHVFVVIFLSVNSL